MASTDSHPKPATEGASRLAARLSAQSDRLMPCVHCGFCLPACPTYTRLGDEADSPRGRLHLMRAVVEGRLLPSDDAFQEHIDRCLGCRACETVCPSGVEYGLLLEAARSVSVEARPSPPLTRLLLTVFGSDAARAVAMAVGRAIRAMGVARWAARVLPEGRVFRNARLGMAMLSASGPSSRLRTHVAGSTAPVRPGPDDPSFADAGTPLRVTLLEGCVQAGLFRRVNAATARTLTTNDCAVVDTPNQGCCGALHAHSGDVAGARRLAKRNIAAFERSAADVVVVNAAGCGAAMREYGHLLEDDPEWAARAAAFADRVRDVSEVLAERGPRTGAPLDLRLTYDAPCHLHHAQRVVQAPLDVLAAVPGLDVRFLPNAEECCGGAGIYGITHPDLGGRIGGDKVAAVLETGAQVVATGNPGCMMQIGAGLTLRGADVDAVHPVEVLDESYRRAGYYARGQSGPMREEA